MSLWEKKSAAIYALQKKGTGGQSLTAGLKCLFSLY
jgi:hypothetical protein